MPNTHLLSELIKRCEGRCFIMDETEIENPPSASLNLSTLGKKQYQVIMNGKNVLAKQFTVVL